MIVGVVLDYGLHTMLFGLDTINLCHYWSCAWLCVLGLNHNHNTNNVINYLNLNINKIKYVYIFKGYYILYINNKYLPFLFCIL